MCNAFKELEAEWMERGIKQSNQQAIISIFWNLNIVRIVNITINMQQTITEHSILTTELLLLYTIDIFPSTYQYLSPYHYSYFETFALFYKHNHYFSFLSIFKSL